ncbi:Recombinase XerD [Vibrio crassostreae]|uniref:site-specific integrase n=1 Tax=Vibrio crassostreae TaxID=246167 RepID=UPI001B30CEDC|nr:site-specific integrase [Vibrio crassostreae]CAK1957258.1 Recombinase XerD [Vibrio crassostreae]CAK2589781.1 Recombinase XerD [Vibrio crassostreae]CAK2745265.1 Recombinase XerD [Vibrio crassostreae]CAK2869659.1 Recombinase XerD [Vibrio crassostreae]CAK2900013.1 Recombinase XerD [Vibrio crassostreae]
MSKLFKFTPTKLNNIPPHDRRSKSTNNEVSDTEVQGLKLLIGKSGKKRFLLRFISPISKKKSSIALGQWPDIDLPTVRNKARKLKVQIADGIDPKLERDKQVETQVPTLYDFFHDTFIVSKKSKGKKTWRDDIARFEHWKHLHTKPIDKITGVHLHQVQAKLLATEYRPGKKYAAATVDRTIALMKTILKEAYRLLDIPYIGDKVSLINPDNMRTRYLTMEETAAVIRTSRDYYCRVTGNFISLLFLTGCRDSELRTVKWRNISLIDKTMFVESTKNGTSMTVPLTPFMVELFRELLNMRQKGNPYVFFGRKERSHISQPRNAFTRIKERAGIKNPKEVCFHVARHSFATNLIENNVDVLTVQRLMNHKDLSSTQRYVKHSKKKLLNSSDTLSSVLKEQAPRLAHRIS